MFLISYFSVRRDLALELGMLEIAREPMPEARYHQVMQAHGERKGGLLKRIWPDYSTYKKAVGKYTLPAQIALFCQIPEGETEARACLSDGHHHFYVPMAGLFESVITDAQRKMAGYRREFLSEVDDDLIRPRTREEPVKSTVAPAYFILVENGSHRGAIMPRAMWKSFAESRAFLTILNPKDLDVSKT